LFKDRNSHYKRKNKGKARLKVVSR